jgi:hypothetical protein
MPSKLIMRWDVQPETESEYFEFLVHELIPSMNRLGLNDIQVWYTAYGECEQKMAEGIAESPEIMTRALRSEDWQHLVDKLESFVHNYSQKVIPATRGFQI